MHLKEDYLLGFVRTPGGACDRSRRIIWHDKHAPANRAGASDSTAELIEEVTSLIPKGYLFYLQGEILIPLRFFDSNPLICSGDFVGSDLEGTIARDEFRPYAQLKYSDGN